MEPLCIGPWGATKEGKPFDYQPKARINTILIRHGTCVDWIRFQTDGTNEDKIEEFFGGPGGGLTKISIDTATDYLTGLDLNYGTFNGEMVVTSLIFYTNNTMYGPYGRGAGESTSFMIKDGSILGFHGRAGTYINAIGVYAKPNSSLMPEIKNKVMKPLCVGPWGATMEGKPFDYQPKGRINTILIRHALCVDQLRFQSDSTNEDKIDQSFGGPGGSLAKITIDTPTEYLTGLSLKSDFYNQEMVITSLIFHTNKTKHGPYGYGTGSGTSSIYFPIKDGTIVGFYGRADEYVNAIGIYAKPNSSLIDEIDDANSIISVPQVVGLYGMQAGRPWDNGVYLSVRKVSVQVGYISTSATILSAVQFLYEKRNGSLVWSPLYGSQGNNKPDQTIIDCSEETLTRVEGFYGCGHGHITSLTFITNKKRYGPFGIEIGTFFSTNSYGGKIVGFFGRSSQYLNAIGVHVDYN